MNVFTKNAIDLWAGSLLFVLLFGWNQLAVMIALSIFTAIYTMKGGLRAVVYADMVQGTWLIVSSIVLSIVALVAVGGWSGLIARVDPGHISMVKPLDSELPITGFLIGTCSVGCSIGAWTRRTCSACWGRAPWIKARRAPFSRAS